MIPEPADLYIEWSWGISVKGVGKKKYILCSTSVDTLKEHSTTLAIVHTISPGCGCLLHCIPIYVLQVVSSFASLVERWISKSHYRNSSRGIFVCFILSAWFLIVQDTHRFTNGLNTPRWVVTLKFISYSSIH